MSATRPSRQPDRPIEQRRPFWARIEYDGTDFYGFQVQVDQRTVQGEIERALEEIVGSPVRVIGAGRTDRGVHARGQVIGFRVPWRREQDELQRALNAVLAADVAVKAMGPAAEGFHPRFSALGRSYQYTLLIQRWRSPLARRAAWQMASELDVEKMDRAGKCLVGRHDYATFGRPPQGENTVRTVRRAEWRQQGQVLTFDIEADAFLQRMVRSIVGMLVMVGRGQMSPSEFEGILRSRERGLVRQVAPAHGLCLTRVDYPEGVLR